jgi:cobyrinic acid a,c-diamide synthase
MSRTGVIIAGLSSSSGKTFITLGLLKALSEQGASIAAAKTGPDYIDPGFHTAAYGRPSVNLDGFAMSGDLIRHLAAMQDGDMLITEGVMGLYDGGEGSAVALARHLGAGIVLVMDIRGQSETAAELATALKTQLDKEGLHLDGVILNRSQSPRHGKTILEHCRKYGIATIGIIPDLPELNMPSRHLGLVQAVDLAGQKSGETNHLDTILNQAAAVIAAELDLGQLTRIAKPLSPASIATEALPPMGQRIALAHDAAFGFSYTHMIEGWRRMGAEVMPFSPLANEAPHKDADFIFLPGGYPELYLDDLAAADTFKSAMRGAAHRGIPIYGECGGYMVLGKKIESNTGGYPMLGLLDLISSFKMPKRTLGYRRLTLLPPLPFNLPAHALGHEFHFTQAVHEKGENLFTAADKSGVDLGSIGLKSGSVAGSYAHVIAAA